MPCSVLHVRGPGETTGSHNFIHVAWTALLQGTSQDMAAQTWSAT